jgi:hypothetical protein
MTRDFGAFTLRERIVGIVHGMLEKDVARRRGSIQTVRAKTTPASLEVPHGDHVVELERDGFVVEGGARTLTVGPGETLTATFLLKPAP